MAENKHLDKDILIRRSEAAIYELFKNIDHAAFHKARAAKIGNYETVNGAMIKIFAHRHSCEGFEQLKSIIGRISETMAYPEAEAELGKIKSDSHGNIGEVSADASKLIKTLLFLLHEGVSRHAEKKKKTKEKKGGEKEQADEKWKMIATVAQKIAATQKKGKAGDDVSKLIKIIIFLLRQEIDQHLPERGKRKKKNIVRRQPRISAYTP